MRHWTIVLFLGIAPKEKKQTTSGRRAFFGRSKDPGGSSPTSASPRSPKSGRNGARDKARGPKWSQHDLGIFWNHLNMQELHRTTVDCRLWIGGGPCTPCTPCLRGCIWLQPVRQLNHQSRQSHQKADEHAGHLRTSKMSSDILF